MKKVIYISCFGVVIAYALIISGTSDAFFNKYVGFAFVSLILLQIVALFLMHDVARVKIYIPVLSSMLSLLVGLILYGLHFFY